MNFQPLPDEELVSRFITSSRWYRPLDNTVKADAFIPHPWPDLSVSRHKDLNEAQLWKIGEEITKSRAQTTNLHGRADLTVGQIKETRLHVEPQPVPENLNHAVITGWPPDKAAQKILAQELAAASVRFIPYPQSEGKNDNPNHL
jgi:hypothetical protein